MVASEFNLRDRSFATSTSKPGRKLRFDLRSFTPSDRRAIGDAFGRVMETERYTCYACVVMPDHVHLLIRKHRHTAEEMTENLKRGSREALLASGWPDSHPVWIVGGWKVFQYHPDDVRRTIGYIERNPLPLREKVQEWPFVSAIQYAEAVDDRGQRFGVPLETPSAPDEASEHLTLPKTPSFQTSQLRRAIDNRASARVLRGTIPVHFVAEKKRVVLTDDVFGSQGKNFQLGSDTFEVEQAKEDPDGDYTIRVSVPAPRDGIGVAEWHSRFTIEDSAGKVLKTNGAGTSQGGNHFAISMHYPNGPRPAKLVVEDWKIVTTSIPFKFTDVSLP